MKKLCLQATLYIKKEGHVVPVEVQDLGYDAELKAFCYIDEDDLICWTLRESVHSFIQVR